MVGARNVMISYWKLKEFIIWANINPFKVMQVQQGTFGVYEKLSEVFTFVQEHIVFSEGEFVLTTGTGHRLTEADMNKTLLELHLVPASILLFVWAGETPSEDYYLKPEVMLQLQSL
ncbi:UBX domain-containing protein 6 [Homalodisca vitripennis]|nr:UBX domain-containing protein 6 [Homalodisca vitripennis]